MTRRHVGGLRRCRPLRRVGLREVVVHEGATECACISSFLLNALVNRVSRRMLIRSGDSDLDAAGRDVRGTGLPVDDLQVAGALCARSMFFCFA